MTERVPGPKDPGSGWAIALNSGGYVTQAYHFYPRTKVRSVCSARYARAKIQVHESHLPRNARKCRGCVEWVEKHPDGGRSNNYVKNTRR